MKTSISLLSKRRFLPLFAVQFLGAFNDNLFRTAMVLLIIYGIYQDPTAEATLSAVAGGLFILPFFLFSAFAGSLADSEDKALLIRRIKTAEIVIMMTGAAGIYFQSVPLMLATLTATGVQSSFFGPIKYAIIPQHLEKDEVLGGTGVVQAGTYVAILLGTLLGGALVVGDASGALVARDAAIGVVLVATLGRIAAQFVPPAPPAAGSTAKPQWNIVAASIRVTREVMAHRRVRLAIMAISLFWALGAVLLAQFPPLVKNGLGADQRVATLFLALFSIGVAVGSIAVNRLLRGHVSARFAPWAALGMGIAIMALYLLIRNWETADNLYSIAEFLSQPKGDLIALALLAIALMGGAFVVPLYAFVTTTVDKSATARTIAVNNIINAGLMVAGSLILTSVVQAGLTVVDSLVLVAAATLVASWLGFRLVKETSGDEQAHEGETASEGHRE
ncbi:MFS transporter [Sphingomicrobium marinum]|uniref:MFS transporter n=1 Tax=Sphingomicrobium marinum TaxID=1227950 RepID=UPI0022402304|nr:MFS transporter [Sphingomicrobium marinum]